MSNSTVKVQNAKNFEIDIVAILQAMLNKLWLIVIFTIIFGSMFFIGTKMLVKPTYRSSFTAYVNNKAQTSSDSLSNSDIMASQELVQTYSKILTSNSVLTMSAEAINLDVSYNTLSGMVSTYIEDQTEIITVYVESTSPTQAFELAKSISVISPKYVSEIVEGSSMKIIDNPEMPNVKYKPSYFKSTLLGALFGMLVAIIFITVKFYTDDRIKNEKSLEPRYSIPVIGVIPDIDSLHKNGSNYYSYEYYEKEDI